MQKLTVLALGIAISFTSVMSGFAASLTVDVTNFQLSENTLSSNFSRQFNLKLSPAPTSEVTTSFTTDGECLLGHSNKGFTTGGSVFTKNQSLHFGIQAVDDVDFEGSHTCRVSFSSISTTDPQYASSVTKELTFIITDNDSNNPPGYNVTALTTSRMQEGASAIEVYEVQILVPAEDDITITALADDQCDLLADNTNNGQVRVRTLDKIIAGGSLNAVSFTIIPREDSEFEGVHQCTIQHYATTDDLEYSQITIPSYVASINDNDANPNIPDEREYEEGLIYYKDANYDGIDDVEQPQVTSFINQMRATRQGMAILDASDRLHQSCRFDGEISSIPFDTVTQSSHIISSQGELRLLVNCTNSDSYRLLWILDQYYEAAKDWGVYQYDEQGNLSTVPFRHIVYNLGDDFTSALVIDADMASEIRLLQNEPVQTDEQAIGNTINPEVAANINGGVKQLIPVTLALIATAGLAILMYRRYLRLYDSRKTIAPDVKRY